MKRFIRTVGYGLLILLAGCSSLQSYKVDWFNRLLATPTPVPVATSTLTPQATAVTQSVTEQPQPAVTSPNVLRIWLPPQFNPNTANVESSAWLKQRLTSFEAEHPGLEVDVRIKSETGDADLLNSLSVTSMAAPKALPDLVALPRSALEAAAQKGLILPLDDFASLQSDDWYPYARDLSIVDGTTYGIPFAGDAMVILYRPELVWIKSWDSILLSNSQLVFAGADPQAQVGLALYVSAGGEVQDAQGKPTLDKEPLVRVLTLFSKGRSAFLFPDAVTNLASEEQVLQEYRARRVQMAITHYSSFRASQDGLLQPLMGLDVNHFTFASGWVWSLSAQKTDNQQLAIELVQYLTADAFLSQWDTLAGYLPIRPSVRVDVDQERTLPVIQAAQPAPSGDVMLVLTPLLQEALTRVLNGEQPEAVARSVIEKLK